MTHTSGSALAVAACVIAFGSTPAQSAEIPGNIAAEGKTVVLALHGEGAQLYECRTDAQGGLAWRLREPIASLMQAGKTLGRHFVGPTWELADGSAVVGKVAAQAPGATARDIAQLKLNIIEHRGAGKLASVTVIQRLDTHGGAYAAKCDVAGAIHVEPYSAEYIFLAD